MAYTASTYLLPYVGTDKILNIRTSSLIKVGGLNVCHYVKSATEQKELIIFTSLGQIVLDFISEADAKLAQNLLNIAIELLVTNCSITPSVSAGFATTMILPTGTTTIVHGLNTTDISVSLWLVGTNELINALVTNRTLNSVDITFSMPPGQDIRVVIKS